MIERDSLVKRYLEKKKHQVAMNGMPKCKQHNVVQLGRLLSTSRNVPF